MNARVLEIVKTPSLIQEKDLEMLEKEIRQHPYMQSLRALYLYGLYQHKNENYNSHLATTAAFTTDKKILYSFIKNAEAEEQKANSYSEKINIPEDKPIFKQNKEIENKSLEYDEMAVVVDAPINNMEEISDKLQTENTVEEIQKEVATDGNAITHQDLSKETPKAVVGAKSDEEIVHEIVEMPAEEKELKTPQPEIVVENIEINELENERENFELPEENLSAKVEDINFHGVDDFLPNIIPANPNQTPEYRMDVQSEQDKKEMQQKAEMQNLIAEVEAKMKANKKANVQGMPVSSEEKTLGDELNFAEVHDGFLDRKEILVAENTPQETQDKKENPQENAEWKPLDLTQNTESSRFYKQNEEQIEDQLHTIANTESSVEGTNLSIESIKLPTDTIDLGVDNSNIPQFINTWHSWLKLDESTQNPTVLPVDTLPIDEIEHAETKEEDIQTENSIVEIRSKAIETFIENEPKISRLKDENDFVHKDKSNDISHLMTETLVNLYVEQKLYAKAIRGYEILQEKNPTKTKEYKLKIEEVKNLRANPKNLE